MNKTEAKKSIQKLIEKYQTAVNAGKISKYTEEETKKGFIEPLFKIFGWDFTDNEEVSAEEHQSSGGRVDYGFYLNNAPKFFLEAKAIKQDIHKEDFAKQAIRYSWNKGVTWAVLTNFETIIVFNAQNIKSKYLSDKRLFEIPYSEYIKRFDQLWQLSKESFKDDAIDKYAEQIGKKIQKIPISEILYKDISECREILTKYLSISNPKVNKDLIDEGIQRLLDRLIFIRVAEDRKIEPPTLIPLLHEWDAKSGAKVGRGKTPLYQTMISKFRELDKIYDSNLFLSHSFENWDDNGDAMEKVIPILYGKEGYYEYDFKVMPADVLGSVYENYLGYRLAKSKKGTTISKDAKKRKEQGIYYTPTFIVDYIVRNALKPVLDKCQSVHDLNKIKVLDPACGSGSFLIKAFEVISEKYKEWHYDDAHTKSQILTQNLYGVDLDEQAVEIARLNLLIAALDSKDKLPLLTDNIKNGNSLISGTDEELKKYFGPNFRDKKPFNWKEEFPEVFTQGGFDVVIGNPPYVNLANIKDSGEREFLKAKFKTAKNKSDLYSFFTEKAINLLKENGLLGFIVSNSWLGTDSFSKFREYLVKNTKVLKLVKLSLGVFVDATVTPVLIILKKEKIGKDHKIELIEYKDSKFGAISNNLTYERIRNSPNYNFSFGTEISFNVPVVKLGDIAKFSLGIKTSDDKRFIINNKKDKDTYPLLRGKDIGRYFYKYANKWIWYKPELMMEKVGAGPRKLEYFLREKILFKDVAMEICATFDKEQYLTSDTLSLIQDTGEYNLKFILALLNSKFINSWYSTNFPSGLHIKINELQNLPIPKINFFNKQNRQKHAELVKLADRMLKLNKELQKIPENSNKWNSIKSEIEKTDKKIDEEVYKLYGLTKEEIKIVEGKK